MAWFAARCDAGYCFEMLRKLRQVLAVTIAACAVASTAFAQGIAEDPLIGHWLLNASRSHYGGGAEPRTSESFICVEHKPGINCSIESTYASGRRVAGGFTAGFDGAAGPTHGISDADSVRLSSVNDSTTDATFSKNGIPAYAYRAVRSQKGRVLTITSVDPATRAPLASVIVYDRR
jgi:hypothetical protein